MLHIPDHARPCVLESHQLHREVGGRRPETRKASLSPRRIRRDEQGIALAFAALLGGVIALLAVLILSRGAAQSGSIDGERSWEQALQSAESGLHEGFADFNEDLVNSTSDVPDVAADPTFGGLTEKAWVLQQAASLTPHPTPEGESVFFTVSGAGSVYAVGYTPDRSSARHERVIKSAFSVSSSNTLLEFAIFAAGDIEFGDDNNEGVITVTGLDADVHANGSMETDDDDPPHPYVDGDASATGTIVDVDVNGTSTPGAPAEPEPVTTARAYFDEAEYVLCPSGWIHRGPANGGLATTPCGDFSDALAMEPWNGWELGGNVWSNEDTSGMPDGFYYAYQGDIRLRNGKADPWNVTLVAEADATTCGGNSGNIRLRPDTGTMRFNSRAADLVILAEREFRIDDGDGATMELNGIVVSGRRARLEVDEGTLTINGALVANATCDAEGEAIEMESDDGGTFTVNYDGGLELRGGSGSGALDVQGQTEL